MASPIALASLGLQAGSSIFGTIAGSKQARSQRREISRQILELERQKEFVKMQGIRSQLDVVRSGEVSVGQNIAQTSKAGVLSGGSNLTRRQAIRDIYGRRQEDIGLATSESVRRISAEQAALAKQRHRIGIADKLNTVTSIIGGAAQLGASAYSMGLMSKTSPDTNVNVSGSQSSQYNQLGSYISPTGTFNVGSSNLYAGAQPISHFKFQNWNQ